MVDPVVPGRIRPSRRGFLAASVAAAGAVAAPAANAVATPEVASPWPDGPGQHVRTQEPDRELRALLGELDAGRIEATVRRLVAFGTRHTLSSQTDPERGVGAARDWILARMRDIAATSGGAMTVQAQAFVQQPTDRIPVPTTITNAVATLRGSTAPERVYVVSGHYDSRVSDVMNATSDAPGADDDASGVAVVLELARVFASRRPEATIVFAAVAGEEQGLYGAAHMAQQFTAAGTDVQAMFTNDIVGTPTAEDGTRDPYTVRLFAEGVPSSETPAQAAIRQAVGGETDSPSRQLARFVADVASNPATGMAVRVIYRRDRYGRGGDHIPFLQRGFPAGRFTEPHENFAHQHQDVRVEAGVRYGDLVEFCDFSYIVRVAKVNAAALWSLAAAPGTPKGVVIHDERLTNATELSWRRGDEPDLAGYEVVWRPTMEPDWTHVIWVGDVIGHTVALSKDNAFFGVRAVDHAGHRSPVAFPAPLS
ncbi:MAG: M20/M25/M40 family metallo-hydrolase [Kutzneria sp.]|nr:M20/M25/M40 family metallo-hydrolase [Kutzneria sp.]